jgi:hypothetical protein
MTDYPPGLLSSFCIGSIPQCTLGVFGPQDDSWADVIKAQFPEQTRLQDSLVHIVGRPRVCGLFGDGTRVCTLMTPNDLPTHGLCDSGANLCMTNNPNFLVDVRPCAPFTISLATSDGGQSHMMVCKRCGLLPLPIVDGTTYYQPCFVNPYASETFISPQAIIDSSNGSFEKWQMEGYSQGRPGILLMYSPTNLLKMSLKLCQQDGLYYSTTDTVTVDTNPRSSYSPFAGSVFTDVTPNVHLINNDEDSVHSADSNLYDTTNVSPNAVNVDTDDHLTGPPPHLPGTMPTKSTPCAAPITALPIPCSRIHSRPTNPACQLESELWAAWLGHCEEDQLIALATRADGLPNSFKFHPFQHIDWKVQARIRKSAAR